MDEASIKTNIFNHRKSRKLTQNEIAESLKISANAYRGIEKGKTAIINQNVVKLANLLELSTEELVLGYDPVQMTTTSIEDVKAEYGNKVCSLEERLEKMEKLVESLEETIASKNEIINMLKKSLAEQK
jgi:transcriptional regulator with XRE-family HTH domain